VSAFDIPTSSPEADGTLAWDKTVLVVVELSTASATGFGYTYADATTARFIETQLAPVVFDADPWSPRATFGAMERAVRNLGREGVAATAIAAVDMAGWDLKAKLLGTPLVRLLGPCRESVDAYGSGGFTSYPVDAIERQLAGWREAGFARVKMKIGRDERTASRVAAARKAIGPDTALFVDANGAYSAKEALAVAATLEPYDVTWFEEPVSSDDLEGLRFVRERAPMDIAAGEYGYRTRYFERMLSSGSVDVLQADATRCGVTGFLAAGVLCEARGVPLSAHCAPTIHAALGCAAPTVVHVEYFHDHARIEGLLFDGASIAERGVLRPNATVPGLGVSLKRADAEKWLLFDHVSERPR
jgi:L-alanine-DL-glutamate epimerase-like enolase superfamily enzyme